MEGVLRTLNATLLATLHALETEHAQELRAMHDVNPDPTKLPPRIPELNTSIALLNRLQILLTPPLHTLVDGLFGRYYPRSLSTE